MLHIYTPNRTQLIITKINSKTLLRKVLHYIAIYVKKNHFYYTWNFTFTCSFWSQFFQHVYRWRLSRRDWKTITNHNVINLVHFQFLYSQQFNNWWKISGSIKQNLYFGIGVTHFAYNFIYSHNKLHSNNNYQNSFEEMTKLNNKKLYIAILK